eukprot:SAG22_NODE_1398_length_4507_cov_9.035617_1_plen_261_part_00
MRAPPRPQPYALLVLLGLALAGHNGAVLAFEEDVPGAIDDADGEQFVTAEEAEDSEHAEEFELGEIMPDGSAFGEVDEGAAAGGAAAAAAAAEVVEEWGVPSVEACDGCLSTLEAVHMQWVAYLSKETKEADDITKVEEYSQPVIQYNAEIEGMVDSMCTSRFYREENLADDITGVCTKMINKYPKARRQVLDNFIGRDSNIGSLVGKKFGVCRPRCPTDNTGNYGFDVGGRSDCDLCHAVVDDALFEIRRKVSSKALPF